MEKTVLNRCKDLKTRPLESLQALQGNLKELLQPEYLKLRKSIEKHGFRFPVFVWQDYLLDGHQRIFTLRKMVSDGWTCPGVPVVEIEAESLKDAKEMVLLISSRYGHITEEGLDEFLTEAGLNFNEIKEETDLPDIDWSYFDKSEGGSDGMVPDKDPNITASLSFGAGVWLGKREEIMGVFEKMKRTYGCAFKVKE